MVNSVLQQFICFFRRCCWLDRCIYSIPRKRSGTQGLGTDNSQATPPVLPDLAFKEIVQLFKLEFQICKNLATSVSNRTMVK